MWGPYSLNHIKVLSLIILAAIEFVLVTRFSMYLTHLVIQLNREGFSYDITTGTHRLAQPSLMELGWATRSSPFNSKGTVN